jgi:5-methylcytosine-specific restriction endonuclease McrA
VARSQYTPKLVIVGSTASATCGECGDDFDYTVRTNQPRKVCDSCIRDNKRASKSYRSRAKKYGVAYVKFTRRSIFERDGYRCHRCKKKCLRKWPPNHPLEPTIDHLIPMALKGPHTPENVACCCRKCNSEKSWTGVGDQLALIG